MYFRVKGKKKKKKGKPRETKRGNLQKINRLKVEDFWERF